MKKISHYLGLGALGLAVGIFSNVSCTKKEEIIGKDTEVVIEDVYVHRYETGKPTCLYSPKGRNIGSSENPDKGSIALDFDINISDDDIIKNVYLGWGHVKREDVNLLSKGEDVNILSFRYKKKSENKKTFISRLDNGYSESVLKDIPFKVRVVDWKGNITEKEFNLEQILKNAKPMGTKPMTFIDGYFECDEEYLSLEIEEFIGSK